MDRQEQFRWEQLGWMLVVFGPIILIYVVGIFSHNA